VVAASSADGGTYKSVGLRGGADEWRRVAGGAWLSLVVAQTIHVQPTNGLLQQ
jgi:hypothetical protein